MLRKKANEMMEWLNDNQNNLRYEAADGGVFENGVYYPDGSDRSISYEALFDGITLKFVTSSHPTPKNDSSVGLAVTFFYPI